MMATLDVSHPDIEAFVSAKSQPGRLNNFNLSVLISDAFMRAVDADADWPLCFDGKVYRTVKAGALFDRIMRATYEQAEPGVLFIDRINKRNKLSWCEKIYTTNPCGEQPLPPYGACMLGSVNLTRLVERAFEKEAQLDEQRLVKLVRTAVRFLDNIIDISVYPLRQQKREAKAKRRIGLGVTGLADALVMCGVRYGSKASLQMAAHWMQLVQKTAWLASCELAREKGSFPLYDAGQYRKTEAFRELDSDIASAIRTSGLRNGLLTSIAPTGTISLLAGNISGGIEPVFDLAFQRTMRHGDGAVHTEQVEDYACRLFRKLKGPDAPLPDSFVTVADLKPADHLAMQAALQPFVDSAISKTVNCPSDISFEAFKTIYKDAYRLGLKGCSTYRPNAVTGAILKSASVMKKNSPVERKPQDAEQKPDRDIRTGLQSALPLPPVPPAEPVRQGDGDRDNGRQIVYMTDPMERGEKLAGYTWKLRWPDSEHAIYVTINDVIVNERRRPFEIFINSKNLEHYAWTVALTRMISAVFRRGGDITFVVEELKAVFDPRGGQWMEGHYVPSLLAAIGNIIEKHLEDIGFLQKTESQDSEAQLSQNMRARYCPKCSQPAVVFQEGCHECRACGYSRCS